MKISDLPARFPIPFGNSASGSYIRTIPEASQIGVQDGAASLTTGFPPLNFLPVGAGGVPPFGQDFNGILRQITQWSRWQGAGGAVPYDSDFSTAIGGYPQGAIIIGNTAGTLYLNTVDDNTTNPNSGGANWVPLVVQASSQYLMGVPQYITSNQTYSTPTGCRALDVIVVGAGGAGGGGATPGVGEIRIGGGGGAGGIARKLIVGPSASYAVTIGAGGVGGTGAGPNGGTSSFGSVCSATGGDGGAVVLSNGYAFTTYATGGNGIDGDLNIEGMSGGPGTAGINSVVIGHGGLGASGPYGAGGNGSSNTSAAWGSGFGAGGGGSANNLDAGPNRNGGNGAPGGVIVTPLF